MAGSNRRGSMDGRGMERREKRKSLLGGRGGKVAGGKRSESARVTEPLANEQRGRPPRLTQDILPIPTIPLCSMCLVPRVAAVIADGSRSR